MGALLGALVMIQAAVAAPAIQNPNFETGSAWTAVGSGLNGTNVLYGQTNSSIFGGDTYGLIVARGGATSGLNRAGFFNQIVYGTTSIGETAASFGNGFADDYRFTGVYQEFATAVDGSISFDATAFSSANTQNGDPFAFIFDTVSGQGTFIRGGTTVAGFSPNLYDGTTGTGGNLGSANRPASVFTRALGTGSTIDRLVGTTFTFSNVAAGNYIIGFGFGAQGNASGVWGGLAVTNIVSPRAVPEIDTASAGLPIAIAMLLFFVVSDRRGRKESAVIG